MAELRYSSPHCTIQYHNIGYLAFKLNATSRHSHHLMIERMMVQQFCIGCFLSLSLRAYRNIYRHIFIWIDPITNVQLVYVCGSTKEVRTKEREREKKRPSTQRELSRSIKIVTTPDANRRLVRCLILVTGSI